VTRTEKVTSQETRPYPPTRWRPLNARRRSWDECKSHSTRRLCASKVGTYRALQAAVIPPPTRREREGSRGTVTQHSSIFQNTPDANQNTFRHATHKCVSQLTEEPRIICSPRPWVFPKRVFFKRDESQPSPREYLAHGLPLSYLRDIAGVSDGSKSTMPTGSTSIHQVFTFLVLCWLSSVQAFLPSRAPSPLLTSGAGRLQHRITTSTASLYPSRPLTTFHSSIQHRLRGKCTASGCGSCIEGHAGSCLKQGASSPVEGGCQALACGADLALCMLPMSARKYHAYVLSNYYLNC